jgi:hypothetical protein
VKASQFTLVTKFQSYLFVDHITPANSPTPFAEIALSRGVMIEMTRKLLGSMGHDSSMYHGHSFRRGGATSLANRGVPDSVIQILGRWLSDCYKLYIDFPIDKLLHYNRLMC